MEPVLVSLDAAQLPGVMRITLNRPPANVLSIEMIPKGSGSENNSFLKMAIPAEGIDAIRTFVVDCVLAAGGKGDPNRQSDYCYRWDSSPQGSYYTHYPDDSTVNAITPPAK